MLAPEVTESMWRFIQLWFNQICTKHSAWFNRRNSIQQHNAVQVTLYGIGGGFYHALRARTSWLSFSRNAGRNRRVWEKRGRNCILLVTAVHQAYWKRLTRNRYLQSTQEEIDTRIVLHSKHAAEAIPSLICTTEVRGHVICLHHLPLTMPGCEQQHIHQTWI